MMHGDHDMAFEAQSSDPKDRPSPAGGRKPLPRFIASLIAACPQHGDGVHDWLFNVARRLHPHRSHDEIRNILVTGSADCGREVTVKEIEDAVRNSEPGRWNPRRRKGVHKGRRRAGQPTVIKVDENKRQQVIEGNPFSLADFQNISPTAIRGNYPSTEWFVELLYPGDLLICVGRSNCVFKTNQVKSFANQLSGNSLIVPSAMSSIWGTTLDGKRSMHTLSNTGERMYLVVEFDNGSSDDHAAILRHLSNIAPLVMVLWSGGKSTHGWFNCQGASEEQQREFFDYAVTLGADTRMWPRCQFARLPQGWRADKQARQQVYFFNPDNTWKTPNP